MIKRSKKYKEVVQKYPKLNQPHTLQDAVVKLKDMKIVKFDPTVDLAVNLGVDPRHADQNVRGSVVLPHGLGKKMRILVFAEGDKAKEAQEAGADYVGSQELIDKIQGGWMDFDIAVATPDMMGRVGRLGRILAPRGLMPNPKVGTVTLDIRKTVEECQKGKVSFRVTKDGIIHAPVGKLSFEQDKLVDNILAFLQALKRAKPAGVKGAYFKSAYVTSTMAPSICLDLSVVNN